MSTDTSQVAERAATVEEVAFGAAKIAAKTAADVAADPIGLARKQVKGLERKGTPTAKKVNRRLAARINAATAPAKEAVAGVRKIASELQPERLALRGVHLVKVQARRQDALGDVAKSTLKALNSSFKTVARVATRFERASEPPARPAGATKRARRSRRTSARRSAAA